MKKTASFILKLLVTVGLFVLLFWPGTFGLRPDQFGGIKPADILREIREAGARNIAFWLCLGVGIKLCGMLCGVLRWKLLLRGQGLRIPFWYMVGSWFVGRTIGIFLPSTIGLDGYRLYDSARYTGEIIKCTTVIVVEKLIGFIVLSGLVFLTLPLGLSIPHLRFNLPILLVMLCVLGALIVVLFLLLLNPRVIQVLVAIVPTPAAVRSKLNKLGAAATAYSGNRTVLLLAVFFGFMVHVATSLTFFCTMMGIRASNTSFSDILFAAPLMITATVFGPSVGGEGIREIVFVALLGAKSGAAAAATFSHLGWWVGDVMPFLVGLPILLLRTRPSRIQLEAELRQARGEAVGIETYLHLAPEVVASYRRRVLGAGAAGLLGGLIAGAMIGLGESTWVWKTLSSLTETYMFVWGAGIYGVLFAGFGLAIAAALVFVYLLWDRFASWVVTFALSFTATLAAGGLVIGLWRLRRDVLLHHAGSMAQYGQVIAYVLGASLIALVIAHLAADRTGRLVRHKPLPLIGLGLALYAALIVLGGVLAAATKPESSAARFAPQAKASGPNIILVAADALRADYLPLYNKAAVARTPSLEALAREGILFEHAFAQASWTKPSFATIFTSLYPEGHTATSQTAGLPDGVDTLTEALLRAGYFTKGFANNPNIASVFNFGQGFVDYTDLLPRRYFGATTSASKLSVYEALRKARERVRQKLGRFVPLFRRLNVRDYYQPAEEVTRQALTWLDSGQAPKGTPFFLFLHYMDTHDPFMDYRHPGVGYARAILTNTPGPEYEGPMREAYESDIEYLDRHLRNLIEGLKQRGVYDNALIIFTADHGEEFYDHKGFWHGFTLYDEMLHVPLIMKLPGNQHAAERNTGLARHVDLAPTILHFAGAPKSDAMKGQSLFDAAGAFTNASVEYSYAHNDFEGNLLHAIHTADAKLITANPDNKSHLAPVELYNLANDPHETANLAGDAAHAPMQTELERVLQQFEQGMEATSAQPGASVPLSDETKRQLEAIGYLGGGHK